jgi:hypothetical protein
MLRSQDYFVHGMMQAPQSLSKIFVDGFVVWTKIGCKNSFQFKEDMLH